MKKTLSLAARIFLLLVLSAVSAVAQPLPKIEMRPAFPNLQMDRPIWMSEVPDGSGRLFFVAQTGKILIVKKGSDGFGGEGVFQHRRPPSVF